MVVMSDGLAFKGKLTEFDDDMLVMTDVSETKTQEIEWQNKDKGKEKKGYILWRKIALEELIIRMDEVLRIWPWCVKDEVKTKEGKKETTSKEEEDIPIYSMGLITFGG